MSNADHSDLPDAMVSRVFAALLDGALTREDLSARKLSAWLGQSTMGLYHHFGSLDGFLIRIDGAGWRHVLDRLGQEKRSGADFTKLCLVYLDFARTHPALYGLIAERHFDRARLRAEGRLRAEASLLTGFGTLLELAEEPTLLVFATLHGLASLQASGRLDLGGKRHARDRVESTLHLLAQALPPRTYTRT
jgi:AcrR family transcriptional regulator